MERDLMQRLLLWKQSAHRKPLILTGVRQCGKTWLLKEFGKRHFSSVAYFNFDEQPQLCQFFESDKDVARILKNLSIVNGSAIGEQTLIILDEIQESNAALNSLKYFCENCPEYHVVCAGSLLGVSLSQPASFPVGKVDFMSLHPLSFTEFLAGTGDESLATYIKSIDRIEPLPELFFNQLQEKLKIYFITGGMPEVVSIWKDGSDTSQVESALSGLLDAYEHDFAKHAPAYDFPKISLIWRSIPSQLARENKKFLYRAVKDGARAREYESALQWLSGADLVYKVYRSEKPGLPLASYDDLGAFKLYMCDTGLLRRQARLAPTVFAEGNRLFTEFKGALAENYVLQALACCLEDTPRYWSDGKGRYEIDVIFQLENDIYAAEIKSSENIESRSLRFFADKYPDCGRPLLRFSQRNLRLDGNVLNIPLFLADRVDDFLRMI